MIVNSYQMCCSQRLNGTKQATDLHHGRRQKAYPQQVKHCEELVKRERTRDQITEEAVEDEWRIKQQAFLQLEITLKANQ